MQQGNIKKALDNLDTAGYRLRCAREYMGLSEKEAADELNLMVSHVRAIEQNRSEYLVQRKPFERYLRAYAHLVQLNPDIIVDMYFSESAPQPVQPVDITTRRDTPPQPEIPPADARRWLSARNSYQPAILGAGFLVIGLSLFAGWGIKQLVGSQQNRPLLAQNNILEVKASTRRQPTAVVPELADIQFEKPVTDELPISPPGSVAAERLDAAGQVVELQPFVVQFSQRPDVELKTVAAKTLLKKPIVADSSRKLHVADVVKAPSKAKSALPATVSAASDAGATTVSPVVHLPLALPTTTLKSKLATIKPIKTVKLKQITSPKTPTTKIKSAASADPVSLAAATPLSGSVDIDSTGGIGFDLDLDDEASDLEAVINAGASEDAQLFEVVLSNSSNSAGVAHLALLDSYKSRLRKRVYENVTYPGRARRRNQGGKVVMSATVSRGGELLSVEVEEASKFDALNRASEKAIKQSSPFPAAPDTLLGDAFVLTVPVVFKVPER